MIVALIRFCVRNPVITIVLAGLIVTLGFFAWRDKTVDAIPDISENQVIVTAQWPGRSPQDVEDQVTYPLSAELASVRGVREVRGVSGFGFSQVHVVFEEEFALLPSGAADAFYEARTRVLEKLSSLGNDLPEDVTPELGPDATPLGQIFMYTVDGPYDLATLRSVQDFIVRFELQSLPGVAEVASAGGMVRQYQVDVNPDRLRHYDVGILDIARAIRRANVDVGAKTIESGGSEYLLRGLGFIKGIEDLEDITVGYMTNRGFVPVTAMAMPMPAQGPTMSVQRGATGHRPLLVRDLATVQIGPEFRRGALADGSGERVGGIVAMRFGANPRDVIDGVHAAILRLNDPDNGILPPGVHITPFYDRTQLIDETVATLDHALRDELIITIVIVLLFLLHMRSSLVIALTLPIAVLASFLAMRMLGVDSNLMSLTGIAIAIGTMVDMGIVMTENCFRRLEEDRSGTPVEQLVEEAAVEVGPALLTAVMTTVISFIPIFFLQDMEGRLFRPLAWTKSLALLSAALAGILVVPALCRIVLPARRDRPPLSRRALVMLGLAMTVVGVVMAAKVEVAMRPWLFGSIIAVGGFLILRRLADERLVPYEKSPVSRFIAAGYERSLRWILAHKATFMMGPLAILVVGFLAAFGMGSLTRPLEAVVGEKAGRFRPFAALEDRFPGLGREFMPPLDEGSLLYMPSLLPQASLSQTLEVMQRQNAMMESVPEVARVVGKLGRAETALDPAPVGMIETVIILKPRDLWRDGMLKDDVINELMRATHTTGVLEGAGAMIQPIETRVLMLNAGIRAPMAIKLIGQPRDTNGRTLNAKDGVLALERVAERIKDLISNVPGVAGANVENIGGKPYLEVHIDRKVVGHYGLTVGDVQDTLTTAVGGMVIGRTVEGRERYSIRVAYQRERRDRIEELGDVLVKGAGGAHVPLSLVARIESLPGPAAIKTEDGRLRLHVTFAARGRDEASVVEDVLARIDGWRADERSRLGVDPIPSGVAVKAAGRYEAEERARRRFGLLIPICIAVIAFLLYLQFRSWTLTALVFSALPVCIAGGLIALAFFPDIQDLMFSWGLWDMPSRGPIHLTVAVVVGFIALAGIATDDGVILATYLDQTLKLRQPTTRQEIREAVLEAGLRRIRPCLMTTFTTIIALYPILASSGRGSDVARPMALPAVGGMLAELISLFIVPTLFCFIEERRLIASQGRHR
ncbi:MAG: efflux RND transporter permease subunit [Planctomycetes bacterium]|nr:efflux RND transporter permease subunit [Planctomycetota bacterium]